MIRRGSLVRIQPDPPSSGGVAQLGEHLLCKQGVIGSIPFTSTSFHVSRLKRRMHALCIVRFDRQIGCRSLTIHRVESALSRESIARCAVPLATNDCVNTNFNSATARLKFGITRKYSNQSLTGCCESGVKVIGSSD